MSAKKKLWIVRVRKETTTEYVYRAESERDARDAWETRSHDGYVSNSIVDDVTETTVTQKHIAARAGNKEEA